MRHVAVLVCYTAKNFGATCIAPKLRDKLREKLPSATALLFSHLDMHRKDNTNHLRKRWKTNLCDCCEMPCAFLADKEKREKEKERKKEKKDTQGHF